LPPGDALSAISDMLKNGLVGKQMTELVRNFASKLSVIDIFLDCSLEVNFLFCMICSCLSSLKLVLVVNFYFSTISRVKKTLRGSSDDIGWLQHTPGMPPVQDGTSRFLELLQEVRYVCSQILDICHSSPWFIGCSELKSLVYS